MTMLDARRRDLGCSADPQEGGTVTGSYPLRVDEQELERLDRQGRALAPATRHVLESAGIEEGMRVLDLGAGAGDTAFLAASLVGPSGRVLGIDRSPDAVARATERARARGLRNVTFQVQDIHDELPGADRFDAVIGRFVLMYSPDPAGVVRRMARALAPGGVVVAIEFDVSQCRSLPPTPLVDHLVAIGGEALRRGGADVSLGPRLWAVMTEATLQPEGMVAIQPHFGPGDPDGAGLLAAVARSAAPLIERTGLASREELDIDTLEDRLRSELVAANAVVGYPTLFAVWATTPGQAGAPGRTA